MSSLIIPIVIVSSALLIVGIMVLLGALVLCINRIHETNRQLMILVAGKEAKPEALRALVASNKPPQGKLGGIASGKKQKPKKSGTENTDYEMQIGVK